MMKYLILDFNGTILDDVDLCVEAICHTAKKYLNRDPLSKDGYREIFTFPVIDYYRALGFDFDKLDWYEVGSYWMDYYQSHKEKTKVFDGVVELLKKNISLGNKNVILSASKKDLLIQQLKELGIYEYFDEILGIDDIYASSKIHLALDFIKDKNPKDCIYVGDSKHDKEVGDLMGVKTILVSKGHESKERLLKYGAQVIDDIREVNLL